MHNKDLMSAGLDLEKDKAEGKKSEYAEVLNDLKRQYDLYTYGSKTDWEGAPPFERIRSGLNKMFEGCPPIKLLEDILNYYKERLRQIVEKKIPDILTEIGTNTYKTEDMEIKVSDKLSTQYPEGVAAEEKEIIKQQLYGWFEGQGCGYAIKDELKFPKGELKDETINYLKKEGVMFEHVRNLHHQSMLKILRDRREVGEEMPPENLLKINVFKKASIKSL